MGLAAPVGKIRPHQGRRRLRAEVALLAHQQGGEAAPQVESGAGQRQRVRLAMTFVHEPQVVLLDEPHTSLDDEALELVEAAMGECTLRGGSVLWCSPAAGSLPLPANVRYVIAEGKVSRA